MAGLDAGDSLDFALCKLALGRDSVQQLLEEVYGVSLHRVTVARALDELVKRGVLPRVGRLGTWVDREAEDGWKKKLGAYVYELNVRCRRLGDHAIEAVRRLSQRSGPLNATVRCTGYGTRIDGALSWAIKHAEIGTRNETGRWLAWRCTDAAAHRRRGDEGDAVLRIERARAAVILAP